MTTIYIDTNIFMNESFFRSASAQAFLKTCALLQIDVVVPEIVIDETKGNYPKTLKEKASAYQKAHKEFAKLADIEALDISTPDIITEFSGWLDNLLGENGIHIAPYPIIALKELVKKSYETSKPFKDTGDGHKDYIVWQTVKRHIDSQTTTPPNYFLTNNSKDFCSKNDDDQHILHPDLAGQIADADRRPEVFSSIRSVFDKKLAPLLEGMSLDDIPNLGPQDIDVITRETLLEDLPQRTAYGFENVPFGNEVSIDAIGEVTVQGIHLTKVDDEVVINVSGTVEIEVSGFIDKHAYYREEDGLDIYVTDPDWNDHVMAVSTTVETAFELSLFYSTATNEVTGYDITLPQEIEDEWPYK